MRVIRVFFTNVVLSVLVIAAARLVLAADRMWPFMLPKELVILTWPLLVIGTLLIMVSVGTFAVVARASGAVGDAPGRLVTAGPFRYMRNPIYVGAALLLFAIALYRQSPSFLLVAVVFVAGIDTYVRRVEEPRLKTRFGQEYVEYKRAVPRWIPQWPRRKQRSGGGVG